MNWSIRFNEVCLNRSLWAYLRCCGYCFHYSIGVFPILALLYFKYLILHSLIKPFCLFTWVIDIPCVQVCCVKYSIFKMFFNVKTLENLYVILLLLLLRVYRKHSYTQITPITNMFFLHSLPLTSQFFLAMYKSIIWVVYSTSHYSFWSIYFEFVDLVLI